MRIVSWNIQQGAAKRHPSILSILRGMNPELICLSEFRSSPGSKAIAEGLLDGGWNHQLTTADPNIPNRNALLLASRTPLNPIPIPSFSVPHRFIAANLPETNFSLALMHIPNRDEGFQAEFHAEVLEWMKSWSGGPCIALGDTNTGIPGIDEEGKYFNKREGSWMRSIRESNWNDAWRHLNANQRVYSYRDSRSGNGFRIDHAFLNPEALVTLRSVSYEWFPPSEGVAPSDHAALLLEFNAEALRNADYATNFARSD